MKSQTHKLSAVLAGLFIGGCVTPPSPATPTPVIQSSEGRLAGSPEKWADSVLATLSLREKAAQLVWPVTLGDFVPSDTRAWLQLSKWVTEDKVGGFIVSVGSPTEVASKINRLQALSRTPLIIGADYEAGAGFRVRGGYFLPNAIDLGGATVFPPEMALGAINDPDLAYAQGKVTAIEGRSIGVHLNFTPVLDVNNNPGNPVINTRSFGEDPQQVARLGVALVRGLQDNGMIATGKHFPGHGDTETNSHLALPVVNVSRARLDSVELVPFRAAIQGGVGAIMSFHGILASIDSTAPATLSPAVLGGVLRGSLGFRGLIVSDALDMKGGLIQYGLTEAVKRAIVAGIDVILQPSDVSQALDAITAGVREGRFSESRVDESARRILLMKARLGLSERKTVDLANIPNVLGDSAKLGVARRIAERSITLVRDASTQIPLAAQSKTRVLSLTFARRTDLGAGITFNSELRQQFPGLRAEYLAAEDGGINYQRLLSAADSADVTIISSYIGQVWDATSIKAPGAFTAFAKALSERKRRPIVVAFGNPYLLRELPDVDGYLVAWGGIPASQLAAARGLLGIAPITGHLPISIPPLAVRGTGLLRPAKLH